MRAAYAVGHRLPYTRGPACQKLFQRLKANAVWEGGKYTDAVIGEPFRPEGYPPVWTHDAELLYRLAAAAAYPLYAHRSPVLWVCGWVGAPTTA